MQVDVEYRLECGAPVVGNDVVTVSVLTRLASRPAGDGDFHMALAIRLAP